MAVTRAILSGGYDTEGDLSVRGSGAEAPNRSWLGVREAQGRGIARRPANKPYEADLFAEARADVITEGMHADRRCSGPAVEAWERRLGDSLPARGVTYVRA